MQVEPPDGPWQKIGSDLFTFQGKQYLIVVDYFSRYIEIALLSSTSSSAVINHMKSIFARHGICQVCITDGGTQYTALEFKKFAEKYGFEHRISSPERPQGNSEAERAVGTIKNLLKKAESAGEDLYLALLAYRSTPLACGYSPSELLMGRRLRSTIPNTPQQLQPKLVDMAKLREKERIYGKKMADTADRRHAARELPELQPNQKVFVKNKGKAFVVLRKHTTPRS